MKRSWLPWEANVEPENDSQHEPVPIHGAGNALRRQRLFHQGLEVEILRIPAKPITDSDLMAITVPSDADHRRSEATLGCSYHAEVIGIRQSLCG
jgi:hypothetical protein